VWDAENPNLQSVVTAITSKLYAAGGFGVQDNVHDRTLLPQYFGIVRQCEVKAKASVGIALDL